MNIHPIFVHFPIALLTVYAFMEIIRIKKLQDLPYYFYIKASFLCIGTLSSFLALNTGEMAEHAIGAQGDKLIEMHSAFASVSVWIFVILSLVYINVWISKTEYNAKLLSSKFGKIWAIKSKIASKIFTSPLVVILAVIGLITITITGALGGAIVYGPDVDPIVKFIYRLVM